MTRRAPVWRHSVSGKNWVGEANEKLSSLIYRWGVLEPGTTPSCSSGAAQWPNRGKAWLGEAGGSLVWTCEAIHTWIRLCLRERAMESDGSWYSWLRTEGFVIYIQMNLHKNILQCAWKYIVLYINVKNKKNKVFLMHTHKYVLFSTDLIENKIYALKSTCSFPQKHIYSQMLFFKGNYPQPIKCCLLFRSIT